MLKKILLFVAVFAVLLIGFLAIVTFTTRTQFSVEREVTINRPKAEVFQYLSQLKNQNDWGPWFKKDPAMKQEFRGTDGQVGFVSHWSSESDEVGEGEQEITRIVPGERVDTQIRFVRPFPSNADAYLITENAGANATKVRWGFTSTMPRPMNLMLVIADMDRMVGKDFEDGLAGLKTILEQR